MKKIIKLTIESTVKKIIAPLFEENILVEVFQNYYLITREDGMKKLFSKCIRYKTKWENELKIDSEYIIGKSKTKESERITLYSFNLKTRSKECIRYYIKEDKVICINYRGEILQYNKKLCGEHRIPTLKM